MRREKEERRRNEQKGKERTEEERGGEKENHRIRKNTISEPAIVLQGYEDMFIQ